MGREGAKASRPLPARNTDRHNSHAAAACGSARAKQQRVYMGASRDQRPSCASAGACTRTCMHGTACC